MRDFIFFVLGAIGAQFIADNLPNLHWRNLWKGLKWLVAGAAVATMVFAGVVRLREERPVMTKEQQLLLGYIVIIIVGIICMVKVQQMQAERGRLNRALLDGE